MTVLGRLRSRRRGNHDRGATLVEFALIAPVLFLMLGAMVDIGLAVIGRSAASNAAREGARVGIIYYEDADDDVAPTSDNYKKITAAVEAKLVGLIEPAAGQFVDVRCLGGGASHIEKPCNDAVVDFDLIEVTVRWTSISPSGGIFTPDSFMNTARMVITGGVGGTSSGCAVPGVLSITPLAVTASESGSGGASSVPLAVSRVGGIGCTTIVGYRTSITGVANPATPGSDFTDVPLTFVTIIPGATSAPLGGVEVLDDLAVEGPEAFRVVLQDATNGFISAGVSEITINSEDISTAPPIGGTPVMEDIDFDGRIDRISIPFNETLATSPACLDTTKIRFPTNLPDVRVSSVSIQGANQDVARIDLVEGTGAPGIDTSNSNITVALDEGCIRDPQGNSASFGSRTPSDSAPPVLVSLTESSGSIDGQLQQNDSVVFNFSEALTPLPAATTTVSITDPPGNTNDVIAATAFLDGSIDLGGTGYVTGNNQTATFPASIQFTDATNRSIRLTLTGPCGGNCGSVAPGVGNVVFDFDARLHGATDGRSVIAPLQFTNLRLF